MIQCHCFNYNYFSDVVSTTTSEKSHSILKIFTTEVQRELNPFNFVMRIHDRLEKSLHVVINTFAGHSLHGVDELTTKQKKYERQPVKAKDNQVWNEIDFEFSPHEFDFQVYG